MSRFYIIILLSISISILNSCKQKSTIEPEQNVLIAKVSGHELRQNDLALMLSPNMSTTDSTSIANAYIETWIRKQLWSIEAEKHVEANPEITAMVESYKSSLLKNAYESEILNEKLDTTITASEYLSTYEIYKNQFVLDSRLLKGWFARIPKSDNGQKAFYAAWKKEDEVTVREYCKYSDGNCLISSDKWIEQTEYSSIVPAKYLHRTEIRKLTNYKKSGTEYNYYLKYIALVDKNELAPLDYIKDELKRVIIHGRKEKIIADLTEELYEKKLQSNQIQVFTNK